MNPEEHPGGIRGYWNELAKKELEGRTIKKVRYLTKEETEESGWYSSPLAIVLDNGVILIPMADDEGNNGGAISISNAKVFKGGTIPVI